MALRLRRGTNAERLTIIPQEGELIYTTDTKELYAGDGATVGGNRITGSTEDSPAALTRDLDLASNNITGIGNINITGTVTANFDGDVIGNVLGDVQGSVFADDSTTMVDGVNNVLSANSLSTTLISSPDLTVQDTVSDGPFYFRVVGLGQSRFTLRFSNLDLDMSGPGFSHGRIDFEREDINGIALDAFIRGGTNGIEFRGRGSTLDFPLDARVQITDLGYLAVGQATASERLDVNGNIKASGSIQPGVYADATARDAAITSPTEGMLVFLQSTQKFVGYVSDTGLAGGGASNATPGWVDLY